MLHHSLTRLCLLGLGFAALSASACSQLTLPRLGFEEKPPPHLPLSINLAFDEGLRQATVRADACGMPWQGELGRTLMTQFVNTTEQSVRQVRVVTPDGSATAAASDPNAFTVQMSLVHHSFESSLGFGDEDQYSVRLNVELLAVVANAQGTPIGKVPLVYRERINIWTPQLGGTGGSCATGQLDGALDTAAKDLAKQLVTALAAWSGPPQTQMAAASPTIGVTQPGTSPPTGPAPLTVRATFLDENQNLILEGGESVGVRIEATNTGAIPLASAAIILSGTPTLLDAFTHQMATPLQLGPLQPGETKATVLQGRMPPISAADRGELTVSVIPSSVGGNGGSVSQTLVVALQPGSGGTPRTSGSHGALSSLPSTPAPPANRYAVVIGVDRYRDPLPLAASFGTVSVDAIPDLLTQSGGIATERILFLKDEWASRRDIEEALVDWLPKRINQDSVVFVYFRGQALFDSGSGQMFLVPYDGGPNSSTGRLIYLPALQQVLNRLQAKLTLLFIEAPTAPFQGPAAAKRGASSRNVRGPNWQGTLTASSNPPKRARGQGTNKPQSGSTRLIQIVHSPAEPNNAGLLLSWLRGGADMDKNGLISVGEMLDSLKKTATIHPPLPSNAPERKISITGGE